MELAVGGVVLVVDLVVVVEAGGGVELAAVEGVVLVVDLAVVVEAGGGVELAAVGGVVLVVDRADVGGVELGVRGEPISWMKSMAAGSRMIWISGDS